MTVLGETVIVQQQRGGGGDDGGREKLDGVLRNRLTDEAVALLLRGSIVG